MDLGEAKRSPSPSAASPAAFWVISLVPPGEAQRSGFAGKREQGNERSFRHQAETESSGLCDDEPPWAKSLAARRRRNLPARNETALSSPPHPSGLTASHLPPKGEGFWGESPHPAPSGPPSPREKAWADGRMGPPLRQKPAFWRGMGESPLPLFSRFSISSFCARLNVRFCFSATRKAGPSHA